MNSHVARRRAAATATGLAVVFSSLVVGGLADPSSAASDRTAATSKDTTYLQDTFFVPEVVAVAYKAEVLAQPEIPAVPATETTPAIPAVPAVPYSPEVQAVAGVPAKVLPTNTPIETVTYDRFQWLLQQEGQFAFVVGSPTAAFKAQVHAIDAAARAKDVKKVYWFDPNLSGYTGLKNLDTRNPAGITSIGATSQEIYGNTWKNVIGQYLGNGLKSTITSGKAAIAADNNVVNDSVDPLWDYRTEPAAAPVGSSDNVFFVYDRDGKVGTGDAAPKDKIRAGVDLTTTSPANYTAATNTAIDAIGAANLDQVDQFKWWQAENNRRLDAQGPAEVYGDDVLKDSDAVGGWNVQQLTYPELIHLLELKDSATRNFAILFGGTWCPNTRAVIKDVNKQAKANDVTVYNFDTVLDGGVAGGGTTSGNNPIQIRNNANYQTTPNYVPSFLYGDILRRNLRNIVTQYEPGNAVGDRVLFYPGGDTAAPQDVVRKLQVPFLLNYQRGTGNSPVSNSVKRQWIQQNTDASTGLPTFREYMSNFWHTNPAGTRIGLRDADFPLAIPVVPTDPYNAPESALLTELELNSTVLTATQKTDLADDRRDVVAGAWSSVAFGQEAIAKVKTFFGGLPGAVVSTQTVTVPNVTYGTAPQVTLAVENEFGRIPAGPATLTVGATTSTVNVAQNAAVFTLPKLAPGAHPFTISYPGDAQLLGFEKTGTVTVDKANVTSTTGAVVKAPTATAAGTYKVSVTTPAGLAAATGPVTVTLVKGNVTTTVNGTVANGVATIAVPKLATGAWKATVAFAGDANYLGKSAAGAPINVAKTKVVATTGAVVKLPTSKKAGTYRVSVATPAGLTKASGKVTVTIKKGSVTKKVTGTVKAGVVTLNVSKLAKGTWKVTVAYAGDANYTASSATGKSIKVKK